MKTTINTHTKYPAGLSSVNRTPRAPDESKNHQGTDDSTAPVNHIRLNQAKISVRSRVNAIEVSLRQQATSQKKNAPEVRSNITKTPATATPASIATVEIEEKPIPPSIVALSNPNSEHFKFNPGYSFSNMSGIWRGECQMDICHDPKIQGGNSPGTFSGSLCVQATPSGAVSIFKVGVFKAEEGASGKRLMLTAFKTALEKWESEPAKSQFERTNIKPSNMPDVVRFNHIQNIETNAILWKHYRALKSLSGMPASPQLTIKDYVNAFDTATPPAKCLADPAYPGEMESARIGERDDILGLEFNECSNNALNYSNADITYPPEIDPDSENNPLMAEVSQFLLEKLTNSHYESKSLGSTAARFIEGASAAHAPAGLRYAAGIDVLDIYVAPKGEAPPFKIYEDENMFDAEMYLRAQTRAPR